MTASDVPVPTPLELLTNVLLGAQPGAPALAVAPEDETVRDALEAAVLPALQRAPCFVSFSGGRDSSAVLAVATSVARRHGLDDPIPGIMRFPGEPLTEETKWQELVLRHLGLAGERVVELRHELDALGPLATAIIAETGVRWPGNAYMHVPLLDLARGGSVLTGVGGDELFATAASRHVLLAHRRVRPRPRDLAAVGLALSPRPVRAAVWRRRNPVTFPWLTTQGRDRCARALAAEEVDYPHRWDLALHHWYRSRGYAALCSTLPALAEQFDVQLSSPFLDPGVLGQLVRAGGPTGFPGREAAMRSLFGDLLPAATITRPNKAGFVGPVWGPATRAFARSWSGGGVDEADVDVAALRAEWSSAAPSFATILLLQTAWWHEAGQRARSTS